MVETFCHIGMVRSYGRVGELECFLSKHDCAGVVAGLGWPVSTRLALEATINYHRIFTVSLRISNL
jgi:hypothetical protein